MSILTDYTASAELLKSRDHGEQRKALQQRTPVVVLISGRGSNLGALVEYAASGDTTGKSAGYSVARVISDNPAATGLAWAQQRGIDTVVLPDRNSFSSNKEYYAHLLQRVVEVQPGLVCLAGFMKVLPPDFIAPLFPKIINIHPSLLPEFPGLNTHERALAKGVSQHGCSIHVVIPKIDAGPLIAQAVVDIKPNDTPHSLAGRVLHKEHQIYPWVVSNICLGEIKLGDLVVFTESARAAGNSQGYRLPP